MSHGLSEGLKNRQVENSLALKPRKTEKSGGQRGPNTLASQNKARKTENGPAKRPADRNAEPRDSPAARKSYRPALPPVVESLHLAGPSNLVTSTRDIFTLDTDYDTGSETDNETNRPTRRLPRRLITRDPSATPAPSSVTDSTPPSPTSIMSAEDEMDMDQTVHANGAPADAQDIAQDDGQPPATEGQNEATNGQHAAAGDQHAAANGIGQPAPVGGPRGLTYKLPPHEQLVAYLPPERAENPHLQYRPPAPAAPIDPELNRSRIQHNTGQFENLVLSNDQLQYGIAATQKEYFARSPFTVFALSIFLGGDHVFQIPFDPTYDVLIEQAPPIPTWTGS
ncbi:hypothetical protein MVEN_01040300 [Mycena venus]|uniref:Uncharacterized protein n=1 Tax=Mycena venus TaxID=2733690 RepID=A0A8H6YEV9_9AGAR|nr:hypothetical protein MVEN_01040300 [Mycena venus]